MINRSLTDHSLEEIKKIHQLSKKKNSKDHSKVLLDFIEHHAQEIRELYEQGNEHYLTETGDMIILCLELLIENSVMPDEIMEKCYQRFKNKLH